jgi:hypothetical protein
MNIAQRALYDRLLDFEFDEPDTGLTFAHCLARKNGWSLTFTDRVIDEYRKFLFLACEADHAVSPPKHVDCAWRLHVTYTRSYWNELCPKVLRKQLHRARTEDGRDEHDLCSELYDQTLASYERYFGDSPPRDIWPPAEQRIPQPVRNYTELASSWRWLAPIRCSAKAVLAVS